MRKVEKFLSVVMAIFMFVLSLQLNSTEFVGSKAGAVDICPDGEHQFTKKVMDEKYLYKALPSYKCGYDQYYYSCAICEISSGETDEPRYFYGPYTHNGNPITEDAIDPTCETEGQTEAVTCSKCYLYISEPEEILPLGHDLLITEAKEPTCLSEGNIKYYTCRREACGKIFENQDAKSAISLEDTVIAKSNDHVAGEIIIENIKLPNCKDKGQYDEVTYCTVCSSQLSRVTVQTETTDHLYINYKYNNDATCTKDGTETAKCEGCDLTDTRTKENSALKHSYGDPVWTWNGTEEATATFTCVRNDDTVSINAEITDSIISSPSCMSEGSKEFIAKVCFAENEYTDVKNEIINKSSHEPKENGFVIQKDPSCFENGVKEHYICKYCDKNIVEANGDYITVSDEYLLIPMSEHDFSAKVQDSKYYFYGPSENRCGKNLYYYSCLNCGLSSEGDENERIFFTDIIHKGSIIPDDETAVEATCTEEGKKANLICSKCGLDVEIGEVIEPLGHDLLMTEAAFPTCVEVGNIEYYSCRRDNCKKIFSDDCCENEISIEETVLPMTGEHTLVSADNAIPAKCGVSGRESDIICSVCSCVIQEGKIIEALQHKGGVATCVNKAVCELCEEAYGELDNNNHLNIVVDQAVNATCTKSGLTEGRHCSDCGEVLTDQKLVPVKEHSDADKNGYCDDCKAELSSAMENETSDESNKCNCKCHKNGITKLLWQIENFFHKILKMEKYHQCSCGKWHW